MAGQRPRIISRNEAVTCQVWAPPEMDGPITLAAGREPAAPPTAKDLEEIQRQAYKEGFELGRREGREQARREVESASRQRLETLAHLLRVLARPIEKLDDEVEHSLVELTMLIARQLVRRELRTNPGEIVAVVREAVSQLPVAARNPRIYLNPDDVAIVREALSLGDMHENYRIEEDPLITRGGCLIETSTSFIDSTVEARISAIASRLFGDERGGAP
jgi:flagellar assembly protein FliH